MFSELFATAPDAMIVVDRHGRIIRANSQTERLFGYSEAELRGQPVEMLIPEQARQAHRFHRENYAANPRVRPMGTGQELTGLKRNGQQFPVEIALSPYDSADGRLYVASVRDISETQRARQAVVRARYDAVIAHIGRNLLTTSQLDLMAAPVLQPIASTLGMQATAFAVKNPQHPQMQARAVYGVAPTVINDLPWSLALRSAQLTQDDGGRVPINDSVLAGSGFSSTYVFPLFDQEQPSGALLVMSRDWRELDRDSLHFLESSANLLAAAMQRIRTEEKLAHAQRLEAVGQLTGGVAHDFNNLLTVIAGNLQLLQDLLVHNREGQTLAATALRAAERGSDLTRKLLAFARRQRLSPRACTPKTILADLGRMLQRTLGETITLEIDCPPGIPNVFADPSQLDSALINLALNSRDAMPRGGILKISANEERVESQDATKDIAAGTYVVFSVRDTGSGMTEEVLARAFEPFFTTKEQGKGSGLGLSMVYGFVKQSDGHLSVESELGYGTCLRLHLPAAQSAASAVAESAACARSDGHEVILVVEDEPDVRQIAVAFLRSLGYVVFATANAEEAMQVLRSHPEIALVFSDIVLGAGMTGKDLAEEIRRFRPGVRILLATGYESSPDQANADTSYSVLQKPYRREELGLALQTVLRDASMSAAPPSDIRS